MDVIMKECRHCNKLYRLGGLGTHEAYCSLNPNKKSSTTNHGGYRKGSGRGKKGWYNGIFCDSSWELAYILYCEKHQIEIKRYDGEKLYYISIDGEYHEYIPDFIINNEQIIEIKGYETEISKLKKEQYPEILVLLKDDMNEILNQIISIHGENFISLYDGISPKKKERKLYIKKEKICKPKHIAKIYTYNCQCCGTEFIRNSSNKLKDKFCSAECSQKSQQKFDISSEELYDLVWKYPTSTVSTMLGVSDKAIEKRCKKLGIEKPPRGYWSKKK